MEHDKTEKKLQQSITRIPRNESIKCNSGTIETYKTPHNADSYLRNRFTSHDFLDIQIKKIEINIKKIFNTMTLKYKQTKVMSLSAQFLYID